MGNTGAIPPAVTVTRIDRAPFDATRIATGCEFASAAAQLFGNVRLEFPSEHKTGRRLASLPLGDCRLSQLQAGVHTVHGERVAARSFDPDAVKLIIQSTGQSVLEQGGSLSVFRNNAPIIYDPTRPYRLVNKTPVRLLMLQLPRGRFPQAVLHRLKSPILPEENGLVPILLAMMRSTMTQADTVGAAARAGIGSAMIELVHGLIDGKPDPLPQMPRPPLDLLLERVKAFIAHNLSRPDLSVELIARRMGCSQRYVYRAFDQHGTTPSDYVWGLRLEHARASLQRQDQRARSITDVAFSLGFSSTSHFSRAFRQRHGMTPSDCRRQA
ncbi:AraC family transcriptional regulator [Mesorhizobium sp. NZP2077]|uniref:AraC family transcriptional regulator n=1 Tax=Mesorhizobium sp. NZP2077 TaxID=2483404 RepID=UPI001556BF3E|nr:AraC family transcriptional regulator [Mesorhizobium sp. NZP2077]QKC86620.1 AraC family transcriptional regulator [Mesorhizobium sp. NZP2077]QKD19048.1 AraC family transcriptional regulator [Mesorhizobium sp. NZP2077]